MAVEIKKPWKPKTEYAKEKISDTKFVKLSVTEMDWRQLKSLASFAGKTVQEYAGQVLREHIFKT